jgi:hypothetical protein
VNPLLALCCKMLAVPAIPVLPAADAEVREPPNRPCCTVAIPEPVPLAYSARRAANGTYSENSSPGRVRQTVSTCIAAILVLACTELRAVAESESECMPSDIGEFVQITSMRLDAGVETFEAFRILSSGRVESARWNSLRNLLDHAKLHDKGSERFERVLSAAGRLKRPEPRQGDDTLGRLALWFEVATMSKSGTDITRVTEVPDDFAVLIQELRADVTALPMEAGWYVWTRPYSLGSLDHPDIDLTTSECDSAVTHALSQAMATGGLIVPANDDIQAFISGEHASRVAFSARLAIGALLFGVVAAK